MLETSARLLSLLSLLQTRREWQGSELADRLEVSHRTIRRDVERLRELGYTVTATRGVAGGYQLAAGTDLPPLLLDDEEAVAIAVGLRTAATTGTVEGIEETSMRALVKLEQVLPSHLRRQVNTLQQFTVPMAGGPGSTPVAPEVLMAIAQACRDSHQLRLEYRRGDGETMRRLVEPHRLVSAARRWYLVAWDCDREDWRTFRVDRILRPPSPGNRCAPREAPAEDLAAFVQQGVRTVWRRVEAELVLEGAFDDLRPRVHHYAGELSPLTDDTCLLRTSGSSFMEVAAWICTMGIPFTVREPQEMRDAVQVVAATAAHAAAG
jgi:predicted DNA-binding transcriptional regulator YafY